MIAVNMWAFQMADRIFTVDGPVSSNSQHAARNILLLPKFDAMIDEPFFILCCSDSTLDPAWRNIVNSDVLLMTRPSSCSHETTQSIFRRSVLPVALS